MWSPPVFALVPPFFLESPFPFPFPSPVLHDLFPRFRNNNFNHFTTTTLLSTHCVYLTCHKARNMLNSCSKNSHLWLSKNTRPYMQNHGHLYGSEKHYQLQFLLPISATVLKFACLIRWFLYSLRPSRGVLSTL